MSTIVEQMKDSMPVSEFRRLLGLGKTESYWLLKKGQIETIMVYGKMRVCLDSFNEWYESQTHYSRKDGIPPGKKIKQNSYSVQEVAEMLNVNKSSVYERISSHDFETFQYEHITRITKESFEKWYRNQDKLRLPEDRRRDDTLRGKSHSQPQIARMLGIGRNEVYALVKRQNFKCITVAGEKRVLKSDFQKWFDSQDTYPKAKPETISDTEQKPQIQLEDKPLYTAQELVAGLGIEKNSLYRMIQSGMIDAIKLRSGYLILQEDIPTIMQEANDYGNH